MGLTAMAEDDFNLFHGLYSDPIHLILSFSTFNELCIQSTVSTEWNTNIFPNNVLWSSLCKSYWTNKYVPKQYKLLLNSIITDKKTKTDSKLFSECIARKAFRLAYIDRLRTTLTIDELVSFKWYFRFKEEAGENFKLIDPFWNLSQLTESESESDEDVSNDIHISKPVKPMGILTNDDIIEYESKQVEYEQMIKSKKNQKKMSEYERRLMRCTRIQFLRDGSMKYTKNRTLRNVLNTDDFEWRFCGSFHEEQLFGDYVQYHSYPKKKVSRHPNNWSFIMQSNWVIFTSFDMPPLHSDDDALIQNNCFRLQDFFEFDFGADDGMEDNMREKLMDKNGMIDLEMLKDMRVDAMKKKEESEPSGDGLDLQYIISRIMGRYGQ